MIEKTIHNIYYIISAAVQGIAVAITMSDVDKITKSITCIVAVCVGIYTIIKIRKSNAISDVKLKREKIELEMMEAELKERIIKEKLNEEKLKEKLK